jgi:hypothetical protein
MAETEKTAKLEFCTMRCDIDYSTGLMTVSMTYGRPPDVTPGPVYERVSHEKYTRMEEDLKNEGWVMISQHDETSHIIAAPWFSKTYRRTQPYAAR